MYKKSTLILSVFCLLCVFSLSAQQKVVRNFLSVNATTAYAGQMRPIHFNPFVGVCENIGIGSQLYANHFTFSIGAEGGATILTIYSKEDIILADNKKIPEGTLELIGNIHVNTPVMIGGEFGKFYFKAGVVPSFNLLNGATNFGPVLNPENPDLKKSIKVRYKNPIQVFGRFELGGSFGKFTPFEAPEQPKARFYLGGYVDFGFTKDKPTEPRGLYKKKIPYVISNEGYNEDAYQFNVGLRFTCLLNFAK